MNITTSVVAEGKMSNSFEFILNEGEYKGRKYEAFLRIPCENPTCNCGNMEILIYDLDGKNPSTDREGDYQFEVDVIDKGSNSSLNQYISIHNSNFMKAFIHELTGDVWAYFYKYFYNVKFLLTKECDLDTLDATFPHKEIEKGRMVAYLDIFPFYEQIIINSQKLSYFVDDQFCLNFICNCAESMLTFCELEGNKVKNNKRPFVIRFDYENGSYKIEDRRTYTKEEIASVVNELKKAYPNIADILKQKHIILRKLYNNYRAEILKEKK